MEELFRFTITRPADRTSVNTLPLERSDFQDKLTTAASGVGDNQMGMTALPSGEPWIALEGVAMEFITKDLSKWIAPLATQSPPPPLPILKQLLADLQTIDETSKPAAWQGKIQAVATNTNINDLKDWNSKLADLFLALLVIRSIGPAGIDKLIRTLNLQPAFAEILYDRPSLNDIADLLRVIDLVLQAATSPLKTANDLKIALAKTLLLPPGIFSRFEKPIHAVGFTDLLVVKQHIARYELGEVARIENILKGESRSHSQKHALSNERGTVLETSTQTETNQELTTADHVSLQNEIENTLKEDIKVDAGVHVQYDGGSVKAQADLTVGYDRSSSESKKFASNIAKDITQKAAKKVTQKIQQTITTKIIETFEENEDQAFDNKSGPANISGVYQWVEKVYLAQVFNYGKHMLFDIMVPEPAASLLLAAQNPPSDQRKPVQPDPLGTIEIDANGDKVLKDPLRPDQLSVTEANKWIGKFQVTGVEQPFPSQIVVADSVVADGRDQSHGDVKASKNVEIPDGYYAASVSLAAAWWTGGAGHDYQIDIEVGAQNIHLKQDIIPAPSAWGEENYSTNMANLQLNSEQKSIPIAVKTIYTNQVSINFEIVCKQTPELFAKWQLQAYEKIVAAWQKLQLDYEEKMAALQFQKGSGGLLGAADPETNRQIERTELKRSCIAILSNAPVDGADALVPKSPIKTSPSLFDPDPAVIETSGSWVRWFEQAFEWDKIGYVFYPYFWGRSSEWISRLNLKNDDPLFLNFLKAGYARVVVPVRNGFEDAVNFYMLTGKPWLGGGLPKIWDKGQNPLYLLITEEQKEQSGAPGDEKPVGDPWEIRLPTTVIRLRNDNKLPMWKWVPPGPKPQLGTYPPSPPSLWKWSEDKDAEQNE